MIQTENTMNLFKEMGISDNVYAFGLETEKWVYPMMYMLILKRF